MHKSQTELTKYDATRIDVILSDLEAQDPKVLSMSLLLENLLRPQKEERQMNQQRFIYFFQ